MKRIKLFSLILSALFTISCQSIPKSSSKSSNSIVEKLEWASADDGCSIKDIKYGRAILRTPPARPTSGSREEFGLATPLAVAAVSRGVDLIGQKLSERAEEKMLSSSAILNVLEDQNEGCLKFTDSVGNTFLISLELGPGNLVIVPKVQKYTYAKSLSGKTSGKRGVVLQFSVSRPGSTEANTQSFNLGDISISKTSSTQPREFQLITNPFIRLDQQQMVRANYPFTLTVSINEVRKASEIFQFISNVATDSNDDITNRLIEKLGLEEEQPAQGTAEDGNAINPNPNP